MATAGNGERRKWRSQLATVTNWPVAHGNNKTGGQLAAGGGTTAEGHTTAGLDLFDIAVDWAAH